MRGQGSARHGGGNATAPPPLWATIVNVPPCRLTGLRSCPCPETSMSGAAPSKVNRTTSPGVVEACADGPITEPRTPSVTRMGTARRKVAREVTGSAEERVALLALAADRGEVAADGHRPAHRVDGDRADADDPVRLRRPVGQRTAGGHRGQLDARQRPVVAGAVRPVVTGRTGAVEVPTDVRG